MAALQKLGYIEQAPDGTRTLTRDGMLHLDGLVEDATSWTFPVATRHFESVIGDRRRSRECARHVRLEVATEHRRRRAAPRPQTPRGESRLLVRPDRLGDDGADGRQRSELTRFNHRDTEDAENKILCAPLCLCGESSPLGVTLAKAGRVTTT